MAVMQRTTQNNVPLSRSDLGAPANLGSVCVSLETCKSVQYYPQACQDTPIFKARNDLTFLKQ